MDDLIYKYDVFNESDIHCEDCIHCVNMSLFEMYCEKTGNIVLDKGCCNYVKLKNDL